MLIYGSLWSIKGNTDKKEKPQKKAHTINILAKINKVFKHANRAKKRPKPT